jgi:hypothetical protein
MCHGAEHRQATACRRFFQGSHRGVLDHQGRTKQFLQLPDALGKAGGRAWITHHRPRKKALLFSFNASNLRSNFLGAILAHGGQPEVLLKSERSCEAVECVGPALMVIRREPATQSRVHALGEKGCIHNSRIAQSHSAHCCHRPQQRMGEQQFELPIHRPMQAMVDTSGGGG